MTAVPSKIYCNDMLVDPQREEIDASRMLRANYVYAAVNTDAHRPLYLARHLRFAEESYLKLYGLRPTLDAEKIARQIPKLLYENRMPRGGNVVTIYLVPQFDGQRALQPTVIIANGASTIYRGYELMSIRPRAVVANYDIPFSGHRTAVSLSASEYMAWFATRSGAGISLRANRSGNIISASDYPLLGTKGGAVFTPYIDSGAGNSVERELMLHACEMAGIKTAERDIPVAKLAELEELMVFGPSGLQSILSCGDAYYYNLTALELEKHLRTLTEEGIADLKI